MSKLTHLTESGAAQMVDVSAKSATHRRAVARGCVRMQAATLNEILAGDVPKGDVLAVARVAGIQAAKRCSDLIPLCHPLPITKVTVDFTPVGETDLEISAEVRVDGKTGVEMEALTAVSVAALTIYDMCKALDKSMVIDAVCLVAKQGGKSGDYRRDG